LKNLLKNKSLLIILLLYFLCLSIEWYIMFVSVRSYPGIQNPKLFINPSFFFFGFQRTLVLLLLPVMAVASWLAWHFLGRVFVSYVFLPYHQRSIGPKLVQKLVKGRVTRGYFLVGEMLHEKSLESIFRASVLPFSLMISISISIVTNLLHQFPALAKTVVPPFSPPWFILLGDTVFINFALYLVLPLLALIVSPIWTLECSGLRYYDPDKKSIAGVEEEFKVAIKSISGVGAVGSFLYLLYGIMVRYGLEFSYVLSFFLFTSFMLYPPTLLATALFIHFSESKSIEKVIQKMKSTGFSLPKISSVDVISKTSQKSR